MTTYEEARDQVMAEVRDDPADMVVMPEGAEDATHWLVTYGPRAWLVGGDRDAILVDLPVALVPKAGGPVEWVPYLVDMERIDAMKDVQRNDLQPIP
jgi:hypothetical protein